MWFNCIVFCVLLLTVNGINQKIEDINASLFGNEIEIWAKENLETEAFKEMIDLLKIPTELQNSDWRTYKADKGAAICTTCTSIVGTFMEFRRQGMSEEKIKKKVTTLCVLLNIQKKRVCEGAIALNLPIILYIVDSRPNLTADTICGVVLESKSCPLNDPQFDWTININNDSRIAIADNYTANKLEILQLTDIHYDPFYEPNSNAKCGEPVCCRKGRNETNKNSLAGFWGDYEPCDTPWNAVVDALTHINDTHKDIDYIYFTGDIIDHGIWETSKEGNIESLKKIYNKIQAVFKNIPVYPIFGNHEPHPVNQFAPEYITEDHLTTKWVYELLADLWINYKWLPESARSTILQGGYYTLTPKKGFRIIALNSNICYSYNWWLWYDPRYPVNQLQWLADTLLNAEKNGEFVHILSHIPANSNGCLNSWKREYLKIIYRFSHLIKAEFNGHTHNDELVVFYNSDTMYKNVAWNGGSITTYSRLNPNYKVYTVDGGNYAVIDYHNWIYDLNSANKHTDIRPNWYESYSFKKEYGLLDLSARSLSNWLFTATKNETLLNKYYRNFFKQAEPSIQAGCDLNCKKQYLCKIIVAAESIGPCV